MKYEILLSVWKNMFNQYSLFGHDDKDYDWRTNQRNDRCIQLQKIHAHVYANAQYSNRIHRNSKSKENIDKMFLNIQYDQILETDKKCIRWRDTTETAHNEITGYDK